MRPSLLALVVLAAGCGGPVDVTGTPEDATCSGLLAAAPVTVASELTRETTPRTASAAAWGDPPIVLRCGVPEPAQLSPTSAVIAVDGITWFPEPLSNGLLFTTVDRVPRIEVSVPRDYTPEAEVLVDLAPAIRTATQTTI